MSVAAEKMPVDCPQCGKQLMVPVTAAGKQGRCPSCSNVFQITAPAVAASIVPDEPDYGLQALPEQPAAPAINPYAPSAAPANSYYDKAPAPEKSGWWSTSLGGVAMMVIAIVWFFGALFLANTIFIYPPILFIIGLVTFFKGLFGGSSS